MPSTVVLLIARARTFQTARTHVYSSAGSSLPRLLLPQVGSERQQLPRHPVKPVSRDIDTYARTHMHTCSTKLNAIMKARNYHVTISRTHIFDPLPSKRTRCEDAIEATSIPIELLVRTGLKPIAFSYRVHYN